MWIVYLIDFIEASSVLLYSDTFCIMPSIEAYDWITSRAAIKV